MENKKTNKLSALKKVIVAVLSISVLSVAVVNVAGRMSNSNSNVNKEILTEEISLSNVDERAEIKETEQTQIIKSTKLGCRPVGDLPEGTDTMTVSGMLFGYTPEELVKESSKVVYGEIVNISESFMVLGSLGETGIMTDVTIKPIETYRGDVEEEVVLRIEGGFVSNLYEEHTAYPEFQLGAKWLFFLQEPVLSGTATEGDYYFLLGINQGAYKETDGNEVSSRSFSTAAGDTLFINSMAQKNNISDLTVVEDEKGLESVETPLETVFSHEGLLNIMPELNEKYEIPDNSNWREEAIAALKGNLDEGVITQEGYDTMVAETYADQGAVIMTDEEVEILLSERKEMREAVVVIQE